MNIPSDQDTRHKTPLSSGEFTALMDFMPVSDVMDLGKIAVATSGGGDSLALTLLLNDWCADRNVDLIALTVNHHLRPEVDAEIETLTQQLTQHGIQHEILDWEHDGVAETGVQETARQNRYDLLCRACQRRGVKHLTLAHNREDQVETFLHRLAKGSGVDGLASMSPVRWVENGGVTLLRPLLTIPHDRLLATCQAYKAIWAEDPSNKDTTYTRVRLRQAQKVLSDEGLTPDRLLKTIGKFMRLRDYLEQQTDQAMTACVTMQDVDENDNAVGQVAVLDRGAFLSLHPEMALRVLIRVLNGVSGQTYPPRMASLEHILTELSAVDFTGVTLHGCYLTKKQNTIEIRREIR